MSQVPDNLKYVKTHEWARLEEDGSVTIGITDHAQEMLGDLVYLELPEVGQNVDAGEECGVLESVKAASDLYSPLTGEVVAINQDIVDAPEQVNHSPYQDGWLFKLKLDDNAGLDDLLDAEAYQNLLDAEDA